MDQKPIGHWAWIVLSLSFANFFVAYSIRLGYSILLPEMSKSLSLTKAQGGLIFSFFFFAYLLFSPFAGNLTDRLGARKVVCVFSIVLASGTTLMGKISSFWGGVAFFTIAGIGASALYAPLISVVLLWFSEKRRGISLGILQMGSALGMGAMGILLPILVLNFGWRFSWYFLGGSMLVLAFMNGLFLRSSPREINLISRSSDHRGLKEWEGGEKSDYREVFRLHLFWIIGFSYFFISASFYAIYTFLVMYAVREIGISYSLASGFVTMMAIAGLLGAPTMLHLSDQIGRRKTILICHLSIFLSAFGLILSRGSVAGIMASMGGLGFFSHPIWPLYGACAKDYFKGNMTGTIVGLWTIFYGVGGIIAPTVAGYLADQTETFRHSFVFAMILVSFSSFFMILMKEKNALNPSRP
jgi:sugar phosphate permease